MIRSENFLVKPPSKQMEYQYSGLIRIALLVCWLTFIGCFPAQSVDFVVRGHSTFEVFRPNGNKHKTFEGGFSIQNKDGKWVINYSQDGLATSEGVMFNGVDVYTLTRNIVVEPDAIQRSSISQDDLTYSNGIAYSKSSTACVFSGNYPLCASSIPRLLWFAFLSSSSLHGPETPSAAAPWGSSFLPENGGFRLKIDWLGQDLEFPQKITFVSSTNEWAKAARALGVEQTVTNAAPFEDNWVAGVYQVMEWTNFIHANQVIQIPLSFKLDRYFLPIHKTKTTLSERYFFQITTVEAIVPTLTPIQLNNEVNVLDYRFMDEEFPWFYVVYPITNRTWKATNDPVVTGSIKQFKDLYVRAHSLPKHVPKLLASHHRSLVRAGLAIFFISAPLIIVGLYWIRRRAVNKL